MIGDGMSSATRVFALVALLLSGCGEDVCAPFSGQSCIALEVRGNPSSLAVTQLLVSASGAFVLVDSPSPPLPRPSAVGLPVQLAVLPGAATGMTTLTVKALFNGVELGRGSATGEVKKGETLPLTVTVTGNGVDLATGPDLTAPVDLAGADLSEVACDTATQSPCPPSQRCLFIDNGKSACRPAGTLPVGAICSVKDDQCVRTTQCLSETGSDSGECQQFCAGDGDCKQPAVAVGGTQEPGNVGHCVFAIGTGTGAPRICSNACNPVTTGGASGCGIGAACTYSATGTIAEYTFCNLPGSAGDGQSCATDSLCQPGFSCLAALNGQFHCRPVCRKSTDSDCPATYQCKPGAAGNASVMFGYCCPAAGC